MADYYPLLARAVAALPNTGREARTAIYDRARAALTAQLRGLDPPASEDDLQAELGALDAAVERLETELGAEQASVPDAEARTEAPRPLRPPPAAETPMPRSFEARPAAPPMPPLKPILPVRSTAPTPPRPPAGGLHPPPPIRPRTPQSPSSTPQSAPAASASDPRRLGPLFTAKQHPPLADEATPKPDAPTVETPPEPDVDAAPARPISARSDLSRPAAPIRPETRIGVPRQVMIWVPLVALVVAGIAFAAWQLRVPQEEFAKPRAAPEARQGSAKINDRAGGGEAPTGAPGAQPPDGRQASGTSSGPPQGAPAQTQAQPQPPQTPAVAPQRAAILVQAAVNDQQNVQTHVGSTSWRLEESRRPGAGGLPALRADVDLPAVGLRLVFLIEKNNDATLRASHMLTFRFVPQEGARLPAVAEIGAPQMRNESAPAVEPLAGALAKITDQIYIVALSADPALAARNLDVLRSRGWFDVPMRLADGRIAKITLEKGPAGERLLSQALDAWQR